MSVQEEDESVVRNDYTLALVVCTGLAFIVGVPWLIASICAIYQKRSTLAGYLGWMVPFTLAPPIGAVVAGHTFSDLSS